MIVFIGDSIFEYWEKEDPDFFAVNNYICRGIRGQSTKEIADRFDADVIASKPDIVLIIGGINDISEYGGEPYDESATLRNIISMAETADAQGIKVILLAVPYTGSFGWGIHVDNALQRSTHLNEKIKELADQEGFVFVDCFAPMLTPAGTMARKYIPDDIHPNAKGYALMKPLIQEAIERLIL